MSTSCSLTKGYLFTLEQLVNGHNDGAETLVASSSKPEDIKLLTSTSKFLWAAGIQNACSPLLVKKGVKIDPQCYPHQVLQNGLLPWAKKVFASGAGNSGKARHWLLRVRLRKNG